MPSMCSLFFFLLLFAFAGCRGPGTPLAEGSRWKDPAPLQKALSLIEAGKVEEAGRVLDPGWVKRFAPLVRATRPGWLLPGPWGFSRAAGDRVYLFIRNWQPGYLMQFPNTELPILKRSWRSLSGGKVSIHWATGIEVFMDRKDRDPICTVIEYRVKGDAEKMHKVRVPDWRDPALNAPPEAVAAWRKLKFGMFLHWGPCSVAGREISWSRKGSKMGRIRYGGSGVDGVYKKDPVYDSLYKKFDPVKFDADRWADLALQAGMKYMVLITKHHDGFCMFDSKVTDNDIMSTPYKKDVAGLLARACHSRGLKLGWYYSPRDWYHPDFGRTKTHWRYCRYYLAQLEELCSNYGKVDILWFDCLDSPQYLWGDTPEKSIRLVRRLQPEIVINDRSGLRGDFDTPEGRIGRFERERPWETCATISSGWSWHPGKKARSLESLLGMLVKIAGRDGNFLLNVPPRPDGTFEPDQVARLKEMGAWLKKYGDSIYATRGGPFLPGRNFASTCKDRRIFLHLMRGRKKVILPRFPARILSARILGRGPVKRVETPEGISLQVDRPRPIDTIVELTLDRQALSLPVLPIQTR